MQTMENTNPNEETNGTSKSRGNLPQNDADFKTVAQAVAKSWISNPQITLVYTTANAFSELVDNFATTFSSKLNNKGNRPLVTVELKNLDAEIDTNSGYVKNYIENKYKKNAKSYYASFGFVYKNKRYAMPGDRNKRIESLKLMAQAIADNGFQEEEFGLDYWTKMITKYETAVDKAMSTDSQVSLKTSSKNELKKQVRKVFNSLLYVIRGNYPDTYKAEIRAWGFQKEKY
jgi:hypothetical protein